MSDLIDWPDLPQDLLFDCVIAQEVAARPGMIATREVNAVGKRASVTWGATPPQARLCCRPPRATL
jgi:hypothetical protein